MQPTSEKIWTVLGQEFGEDYWRKAMVVCALCGLKITGATFWEPPLAAYKDLGRQKMEIIPNGACSLPSDPKR